MELRPTILITGASGQLGSEFRDMEKKYPSYHFIFLDREVLDISNLATILAAFEKYLPSFVINCAAYTAVDKAEEEEELAMNINASGAGHLATASKQFGAKLVHISTDYVFDGSAKKAYKEDDQTNPINVYGASKLLGEELVKDTDHQSIIIRTSWVYSVYGKNFVKTMARLLTERDKVRVVSDQVGCPTYAADLAAAIMQIIDSDNWVPGMYHFSNEGVISWYEFALAIKELIKSHCKVEAIPSSQFPTPATRPAYSVLDNTRIKEVFGIKSITWKTSLERCINKLTMKSK